MAGVTYCFGCLETVSVMRVFVVRGRCLLHSSFGRGKPRPYETALVIAGAHWRVRLGFDDPGRTLGSAPTCGAARDRGSWE